MFIIIAQKENAMNNQSANVKFSTQLWKLLIFMNRQEDLND
ncbi:hypothetical protein CHCC20375_3656 [Bacillus licheniformis]|nr:hypothetical protein CHCC20375_3656 [Bacillus licheniformis]